MNNAAILYPILAHIFLVFILYILMGVRKHKAVKAKDVNYKEASLNNKAWPERTLLVTNNLANQSEAPVLFYALCIVTFLTNTSNVFAVGLAIAFVSLRYIHSYVHVTSNYVPHRALAFMLSLVTLLVLFIQTTAQVILNAA